MFPLLRRLMLLFFELAVRHRQHPSLGRRYVIKARAIHLEPRVTQSVSKSFESCKTFGSDVFSLTANLMRLALLR
jgi:hypothetical protein